jgi:DNA-binding transcriptional ArsR family regulator
MKQKAEYQMQKSILLRDENPYSRELAEIKAEIASLNLVVTRSLESSNRQQMNKMLSDIREDISRPMMTYMFKDTKETLECMHTECDNRNVCKSAIEELLQEIVLLLIDNNIDENTLTEYQHRFDALKAHATTSKCDSCIVHAAKIFDKQIELVRSFSKFKDGRKDPTEIASISTLSEDIVNSICEPLANRQRLLIMRSLVNDTKSFSELSKITNLRGGNLLFHIQKLLDTGMILQKNERGDYLITSKGQITLQGLADLYTKIGNE